jgi:hypothetical protein
MKVGQKIAIYWIQKDYGGVEEVLLNLYIVFVHCVLSLIY